MKRIIGTVKFTFQKSTQAYIIGVCLVVYLLISSVAQAAFKGYISPKDAFNWASTYENVYILDVRTGEEWFWVGHPGPNGLVGSKNGKAHGLNYNEGGYLEDKVVNIAYWLQAESDKNGNFQFKPNGSGDPDNIYDYFIEDVNSSFDPVDNLDPGDILLVMCKTGGRAQQAADLLGSLGYTTYNIHHGFQGDANKKPQPGRDTGYPDVNGWVNEGLPWNRDKKGGYYSQ